jgi:hypothetical protein
VTDPLPLLIAMARDWTNPAVVRDAPERAANVIEQLIEALAAPRMDETLDEYRTAHHSHWLDELAGLSNGKERPLSAGEVERLREVASLLRTLQSAPRMDTARIYCRECDEHYCTAHMAGAEDEKLATAIKGMETLPRYRADNGVWIDADDLDTLLATLKETK